MDALKRLACLVLGHKPHLDFSGCLMPEPNVFVGPVRRYCGRCATELPGDDPEIGDVAYPPDLWR